VDILATLNMNAKIIRSKNDDQWLILGNVNINQSCLKRLISFGDPALVVA
jgi:hypothetical protein